MPAPITATLWITVGLTFYGGDFEGQTLACGGVFTESVPLWAAVPIEWNQAGYVSCGDLLAVEFGDGQRMIMPVLDFGCHLHHAVWDTGVPFGADFPRYGLLYRTPTATGRIAIKGEGGWIEPPPLDAWGKEWCSGPLTMRGEDDRHQGQDLVCTTTHQENKSTYRAR